MDPDLFRVSLRAIFAAIVTEIPDQFLFLGVDRDHRLLLGQCGGHLGVDAGELRIPVGVAIALFGFAVGLQAVARRIEQLRPAGCGSLRGLAPAAPAPAVARSCRSTATEIPDPRGSLVRPAPRDPRAGSGPCKSPACAPPLAAEPAWTAHPAPIPSARARSCSAPCRSASPPQPCHHIPRQMPPPPRPDDGPVHQETAPPSKTALEWARHQSQPPYMV